MAKKDIALSFLDRVLTHLPEAERATVGAALRGNDQLLEAIGEDAEALAADRARLTDWFNTNRGALQQADTILKAHKAGRLDDLDLGDGGDADPDDPLGVRRSARRPAAAARGLDEATVNQRIADAVAAATQQTESNGLTLINKMTKIGIGHLREFDEVLDTDELTTFAVKHNLRLDLAYDQFVKTKRDTRTAEANTKALADAEARGRAAGQAEALNRNVPVPAGSAAHSTLSGLTEIGKVDASMPALIQELRAAGATAV